MDIVIGILAIVGMIAVIFWLGDILYWLESKVRDEEDKR